MTRPAAGGRCRARRARLRTRRNSTWRPAAGTGWNEALSDHHPIWDRGGWQETGPGRVRISLANDAEREYEVSLDGDVLTAWTPTAAASGGRARLAQPENGT